MSGKRRRRNSAGGPFSIWQVFQDAGDRPMSPFHCSARQINQQKLRTQSTAQKKGAKDWPRRTPGATLAILAAGADRSPLRRDLATRHKPSDWGGRLASISWGQATAHPVGTTCRPAGPSTWGTPTLEPAHGSKGNPQRLVDATTFVLNICALLERLFGWIPTAIRGFPQFPPIRKAGCPRSVLPVPAVAESSRTTKKTARVNGHSTIWWKGLR